MRYKHILSQLEEESDKLHERQVEIDKKLLNAADDGRAQFQRLRRMDNSLPDYNGLQLESKNISQILCIATDLADGISSKVRHLDLVKRRVAMCIQRVQDLLDLQICTDGVQKSLLEEDYETAAGHVHTFLSLDANVLRIITSAQEGTALQKSIDLLHSARNRLRDITSKQFQLAAHQRDAASIERFFKLFPLIGLHEQGLERFGEYLAILIREKYESKLIRGDGQNASESVLLLTDRLTLLFEIIAEVVDSYQVQIETYYGPGKMFPLMRTIQNVCDEIGTDVIHRIQQMSKLENVVQSIRAYMKIPSTVQSNPPVPTLDLDKLADHLALPKLESPTGTKHEYDIPIAKHAARRRTVSITRVPRRSVSSEVDNNARLNREPSELDEEGVEERKWKELSMTCTRFFDTCALSQVLQAIVDSYLLIEQHRMSESVRLAVQLCSPDETNHTLTMIDDIFYVLKKCTRRSLLAGSIECTCALLNQISLVLEERVLNGLIGWLKLPSTMSNILSQATTTGGNLLASIASSSGSTAELAASLVSKASADAQQSFQSFLYALNSCDDVAERYLPSLIKMFEEEVRKTIGITASASDPEKSQLPAKLQLCLKNFAVQANAFRRIRDGELNTLRSNFLVSYLRNCLQPLLKLKFVLSENDYIFYSGSDPWVDGLLYYLEEILISTQAHMNKRNCDAFVLILTEEVVDQLERIVLKKSYNLVGSDLDENISQMSDCRTITLGGQLLESSIRRLSTFLSRMSTWGVREKFARLMQCCSLLAIENLEEAIDYRANGSWRLKRKEEHHILSLSRIILPMTVEEYRIAQLWSVAELSKLETGGGEGVEICANVPFDKLDNSPESALLDDTPESCCGQYSYKLYHMGSKVPMFVRLLAPKHSLDFEERAWNAYPYCRTVITNQNYMKENFTLKIETLHLQELIDEPNVHKLSDEQLAMRKVVYIDISNDPCVPPNDYNRTYDPMIFQSASTGRGPLVGPHWWKNTNMPIMCAYKLVTTEFKWWGLQNRIEEFIQRQERRLFLNFHRKMFCWMDLWHGLSLQDIRELEEKTKQLLDEALTTEGIRGTVAEE